MNVSPDMNTTNEAAKPFVDSAIWSAIPSLAWVLLIAALIWWLRSEIKAVLVSMVNRLKAGGQLKIGAFEIGTASGLVAAPGDFSKEDSRVGVRMDSDGVREKERDLVYQQSRRIMLVHRIQRSSKDGQLYDILIYVIPHKGASLAGVTQVEYFFGNHWGNKIYPSSDRSRGFPVVTAAYGPFLCTAQVSLNDGTTTTLSRYIDFEMGALTQPSAKST